MKRIRMLPLFCVLIIVIILAGCAADTDSSAKPIEITTEDSTKTPDSEGSAPTLDPLETLRAQFDDREGPEDINGVTVEYHVYSPVKGEDDPNSYPVMIWIHGMGQGLESRMPLYGSEVANFASEEYQKQFSVDGDSFGAYIVVPRANEDDGKMYWGFYTTNSWMADADKDGRSDQLPALKNAIHQFLEQEAEHIDRSRIYLGGFSAGGYMTWQTLLDEPELYAAAYPICPAYAPTAEELEQVKQIPIWMISGRQDPTVRFEKYVAPTWDLMKQTSESDIRLSAIEFIYESDGKTPVATQHCAWVAVTNNMLFDDSSPYDPNYPDGFLPWLAAQTK